MAKHDCEGMVETILRNHGVTFDRNTQGKHIKFSVTYEGKRKVITVPKSASDRRGSMNLYSDTRRALKELGVDFKDDKSIRA